MLLILLSRNANILRFGGKFVVSKAISWLFSIFRYLKLVGKPVGSNAFRLLLFKERLSSVDGKLTVSKKLMSLELKYSVTNSGGRFVASKFEMKL